MSWRKLAQDWKGGKDAGGATPSGSPMQSFTSTSNPTTGSESTPPANPMQSITSTSTPVAGGGSTSADSSPGWGSLLKGWRGKPAQDAEWDETKHKRGAGGQFGSGGGAKGGSKGKWSSDLPSGSSGPHKYNPESVNNAIASSNRAGRRIGSREAKLIHSLMKGPY